MKIDFFSISNLKNAFSKKVWKIKIKNIQEKKQIQAESQSEAC